MASGLKLPKGFILEKSGSNMNLPEGFVLEGNARLQQNNSPQGFLSKLSGGVGYGAEAVRKGLNIKDAPHILAKAASGLGMGAPEIAAKNPVMFGAGGMVGAASGKSKRFDLFPKASSEGGEMIGGATEFATGMIPLSTLSPIINRAYKFGKIKMMGGRDKVIKEAENELIRVLRPPVSQMDAASNIGKESPSAIEKALPYIKKSKNYEELTNNLRKSKNEVIRARNAIIRGKNVTITADDYLTPLRDEIEAAKRNPTISDEQIAKMQEIYDRFSQKAPSMSRVKAQALKTQLQRETESLLKKASKGLPTERSSTELKALDRVRFGLRKMVEAGDERVSRLNEDWEGLRGAEKLARRQYNLSRKAPRIGISEKLPFIKHFASFASGPKAYSIQIAREALKTEPSMSKLTGRIADLYKLSKYGIEPKAGGSFGGSIKMLPDITDEVRLIGQNVRKPIGVSSKFGSGFVRPEMAETEAALQGQFAKKLGVPEVGSKKINPMWIKRLGKKFLIP